MLMRKLSLFLIYTVLVLLMFGGVCSLGYGAFWSFFAIPKGGLFRCLFVFPYNMFTLFILLGLACIAIYIYILYLMNKYHFE